MDGELLTYWDFNVSIKGLTSKYTEYDTMGSS